MIKYKIRIMRSSTTIDPVECISETEHMVTIQLKLNSGEKFTRKEKKITQYDEYHDTWESAQKRLLECMTNKLNNIEKEYNKLKDVVESINGMKEPK